MNMKKILAAGLAATMVLGSTMTVFADPATTSTGSGSSSGTSTNEGLVDTEIYSVTLPTVADGTYNFYLDPQSNIEDTTANRYTGYTPTNTTNAYFKTTDSTLTAKSASATVTNSSYNDLDVTVKVEITGNKSISIEESGTITNTTPTMFMGLESTVTNASVANDTSYVPSTGVLEKTFTLDGDAADYKKSWDSANSKYVMTNTGASGTHTDATLAFNLVVGCNSTEVADWTGAASTETPAVEVTWSYGKHVDFTFEPTNTATNSSDGTKFVITPASKVTSISAVKVIDKQTGAVLGTLQASDYTLATSGNIAVLKTAVKSAVGDQAGTYGVVVTTDIGELVFEATVS